MVRLALPVLAALVITAGAGDARADDVQAFELAKTRFDAGQYEEANALFSSLLDPANPPCGKDASRGCRLTDPDLVERARTLDAAALLALKKTAEAEAQIERVLRQNPTYTPNPALFPQELVDRFTDVRARLRSEFERTEKKTQERQLVEQNARQAQEAWIQQIVKQASEERVVTVRSRWIAALPFGAGQYQNGDIGLGVFFTTSQALLGATSIVSGIIANSIATTDIEGLRQQGVDVDRPALNAKIRTASMVNLIAFSGWAVATIAGVVQAQIAFKEEKVSTRQRTIPPRPVFAPTVSSLPGGAAAGLIVRF